MKKNAMLKIAAILLVAVLLTTCAISTTFAKYTSSLDTAAQTAQVAHWGIDFSAATDGAIFKQEYANGGFTLAASDDYIVAPGTSNSASIGASATGSPEVAFKVVATVDVALTGWVVDGAAYCPLTFKVNNGADIKIAEGATNTDNLEKAIEAAIAEALLPDASQVDDTNEWSTVYEPGDAVDNKINTVTISWEWPQSVDDEKDTKLGNAETKAEITIDYSLKAEQIFSET